MLLHVIFAVFAVPVALANSAKSPISPFLQDLYGAESDYEVSTIGTDSHHATTYNVKCITATIAACDFPAEGGTVVDSPSSVALSWVTEQVTFSLGCAYLTSASSSLAACTSSMGGPGLSTISGASSFLNTETWAEFMTLSFNTPTATSSGASMTSDNSATSKSTASTTTKASSGVGASVVHKWCQISVVVALLSLLI